MMQEHTAYPYDYPAHDFEPMPDAPTACQICADFAAEADARPHKCGDGSCEYEECMTSWYSSTHGLSVEDQPCRCERCPTNKEPSK